MTDVFRAAITEPSSATAPQYARRVRLLAVIYVILVVSSIAGEVLIAWRGQFFVTLAQRSNVETLVLLFFMVFFAYIALISLSGAIGAIRLAYHNVSRLWIRDWKQVERNKMDAIGPAKAKRLEVAMNLRVHEEGRPDEPVEIEIRDEAGQFGVLRIDGARFAIISDYNQTSNSIFVYVEHQLNDILKEKGEEARVDVMAWKGIDNEAAEQYLMMVNFARNLERALDKGALWPQVVLTADDVKELRARLSLICRALRNECFLPDWEYSAEHKVPIIPEPLALASISRSERRADPLATMGLAAGVVVVSVIGLAVLIAFPPWVPA